MGYYNSGRISEPEVSGSKPRLTGILDSEKPLGGFRKF